MGSRLACLLLLCAAVLHAEESTYRQQVIEWREARESRLRSNSGWLTMVGLFAVGPGTHTIGARESSDVIFPDSAPGSVGTLSIGESIEFTPTTGIQVQIVGDTTRIAGAMTRLLPDAAADGPTRLRHGSLTWWMIERDGSLFIRLSDKNSAYLRDFAGLAHYPVDEQWRVTGRWVAPDSGRTVGVPTILGTISESTSGGFVEFEAGGGIQRLELIGDPDDDEFFVIFGDATNGIDTYGAGRFLWIDGPAADGTIHVDFNKAYSPPCAFTPYATCPLPPPGNRLQVAITAGEMADSH